MSKVWFITFITGAGRGMGVDIAKAALAAGHKVVATGRNTDKVAEAVGNSANLLIVPADAESAVKAAVDKFRRIDVLVNNAANFYAGFFEELTPEQTAHSQRHQNIRAAVRRALTKARNQVRLVGAGRTPH